MTLTTTSYAILGLLDLRDWTAYELAEQARRSLAFAWPMSSTQLYAEPKRLAAEGLITISTDPSGARRTRQRLSITPEGRTRLREWLASEPAAPRIQIEALLRALLSSSGTKEDLMAAVESTGAWARSAYDVGRSITEAYRDGDNPFPERLQANVVWMVFVRDLMLLLSNWSDFAAREVRAWPDSSGGDPAGSRASELIDAMLRGGPGNATLICCAHEDPAAR